MKRKRLLILAIVTIITMSFMTSCAVMSDSDFQEGFRQGWNSTCAPGYEY